MASADAVFDGHAVLEGVWAIRAADLDRVKRALAAPERKPGLYKMPSPLRVLLIDGNPKSAALTVAFLKAAGYSPAVAGDGETGLSIAAGAHPDVVLLDMGLSDVPAASVARELTATVKPRSIIGLADARLDEAERTRFGQAGITLMFTRPIPFGELRELLEAMGRTQE